MPSTKLLSFALIMMLLLAGPAFAEMREIDFDGLPSGPLIDAVNGDFAQTFAGQTVSGIEIIGEPTAPLELAPSGDINVEFFAYGWSLLPQPDNTAPLSVLLETEAKGPISWVMGHAAPPSTVDLDFFDSDGELVLHWQMTLSPDYSQYNLDIPYVFKGFTISSNTDPGGLRFYDFRYTVYEGTVAENQSSWDEVKALYR